MSVKEMLHKEIDKLPDNLTADVFNYVLFLENQLEKIDFTRQTQIMSEAVFSKIWDNEEDAIYDTL